MSLGGTGLCVCVCGPGNTHVVGTYIYLHCRITGTCVPYGDEKQVPIT